jgi:hypothetical protein
LDWLNPGSHRRLCYYPSSGDELLWAVMQLDSDLFVFADADRTRVTWASIRADFEKHRKPVELVAQSATYVQFTSNGKLGVLFHEDNNLTLDRLHAAGAKVHHFVGICDGCSEGGNYECVHDEPFVRSLMRVAVDGMRYTTDHSGPLQEPEDHRHWYGNRPRRFLQSMQLRAFPPSRRQRHREPAPELDFQRPTDARFELQGVLVRRPGSASDMRLSVLSKGFYQPAQLDALIPFRTIRRRPILAEYWVGRWP